MLIVNKMNPKYPVYIISKQKNKLIKKSGIIVPKGINNYGMKLVKNHE